MPWKACKRMDERLKFIARLLEQMPGLCREFSISRKTGCKILTHYSEISLEVLTDRGPQLMAVAPGTCPLPRFFSANDTAIRAAW